MSKLIPMEEAAKFLGLSVEELNELRENNEVFGYRDGSTWKFKKSELERVAGQSGFLTGGAAATVVDKVKDSLGLSSGDDEGDLINESGDLSFEIDESLEDMVLEDSSDSIAMEDSSLDLFQPPGPKSGGGTSSDILSLDDDDDDDDMIDLAESGLLIKSGSKSSLLNLTDDEDEGSLDESGDLNLASEADLEESKKDVSLDDVGSFNLSEDDDELVLAGDDDKLSFGSSSLELASGSEKKTGSPSTGDDLLDEEPKSSGSPSATGNLLGGDDGDDDLMLAGDDLDLELADSGSFSEELSDSSGSSELVLEEDSSDDLILEANESGLALSPNESGLMLGDDLMELGGSDIDELELPEEDDDLIMVEGDADPEMAPLMQEDDFSLTPHELSMDDDDASGSQIIALADSEIYADDSEATLLGDGDGDYAEPGMYDDGLDGGYDPATGAAVGYAGVAAPPEAPYTIGQIISLIATVAVLFIGCIVAYGMAQNLWMPDGQVVKSGLVNMLLDAFGLKS